jgi:hypothetical protein
LPPPTPPPGYAAPGQPAPPQAAPEAKPQQPPTPKKPRKLGFFAGFDTRLSEIDGAFATTLGGVAGVILAQRLMIGGAGYGLVFHDRKYIDLVDTETLNLGYGGAQIGFYAVRSKRLDGGFNVFLGGGRVCLDSQVENRCVDETAVFVSHVEGTFYIKIAPVVRLAISGGYNFISGANSWHGPDSWDLSGFGGSFRLEFGKFQMSPKKRGRRR